VARVEVELDIDHYLEEISDYCLLAEINDRIAKGNWSKAIPGRIGVEAWTRKGLTSDLRNAFYLRDASRMEELLLVLEAREEPK
jgi:hypothetical protein